MKCYRTTAAVLFLVLGAWSYNAYATSGYSWIGGYVSGYDGPDIGDGIQSLSAYAYLLTSNGTYEENTFDQYWAVAWAGEDASYGQAYAGWESGGGAEAYAEAWDGLYTKAIGQATAQFGFTVDSGEDLGSQITIDMNYDYWLEVYAENPGNWAHSDAVLSVVLMNTTTGQESSFEVDYHLHAVEGEYWDIWEYPTTSVSLFFNNGDEGMLRIDAYAFAEASGMEPVNAPAPGAMVLGSLGLGLVGWLRRRGSV